jgi:hypothetical protein
VGKRSRWNVSVKKYEERGEMDMGRRDNGVGGYAVGNDWGGDGGNQSRGLYGARLGERGKIEGPGKRYDP